MKRGKFRLYQSLTRTDFGLLLSGTDFILFLSRTGLEPFLYGTYFNQDWRRTFLNRYSGLIFFEKKENEKKYFEEPKR